ncbi:CRISPR-associated helicase/endonuclease Cas3 [Oceanospirillum linum]|uniref:CRISPR-associated helicase/endonuclease Cas3 n=1 Tax=Oceanospirillum linum TaxID=966 RepID=UPI00089F49E7|nr:CRISPR-associated helicase/endonuclease Cas3 [Oceanospirillum linum]SEG52549.1 CRISPR-associated helicase, Cas3 family [Oleiphilus messinensis]SMP30524.1 CRISPR-associated helicase, Cas3 family [Oceanospirillum linum]
MDKLYYRYWGKAKKDSDNESVSYHLLPYHCLDVAVVAECWWEQSSTIRNAFMTQTGLEEIKAKAWILFFIALHDYGKWDLRFQRKAPSAYAAASHGTTLGDLPLSPNDIKKYFHGPEGLNWFFSDFESRFDDGDWLSVDSEDKDYWLPWLAAVAGHHGEIPETSEQAKLPLLCKSAGVVFKQARMEWVNALEQLFLTPAGLSFSDNPPLIKQKSAIMLAGFCSVCDWLGSSDFFSYDDCPQSSFQGLKSWYRGRFNAAEIALKTAGLHSQVNIKPDIEKLLGENYKPRQVQALIQDLPLQQSLTLIEASTGSGKTEAALAYAWHLLDAGLADSIVFALPTQATANAMYTRLEKAANTIFCNETNLILAHGRSRYHEGFINLKQTSRTGTLQGNEEAWVQCSEWLAQSRKRIFLGQIGVCTVDQVLVSVLPIKHKFVRGFGIGRSVLIIDEIHAYDSYMYGLLGGVLEQQKASGGSAILLSATLPEYQKLALSHAWQAKPAPDNDDYPLITSYTATASTVFDLHSRPELRPESTQVEIELLSDERLLPDDNLLLRIEQAVISGAQVCLICNLVDVAQHLFQIMQVRFEQNNSLNTDQLGLFHSRFSFHDRQNKEELVVNIFGKDPDPRDAREKGHFLIATQVVEQSLDLDFDWLITQLCPVDLLFQRMGRLHRHKRTRPHGFEQQLCSVLVPEQPNYDLHELIYGNSRVLWRTHQLLEKESLSGGVIEFPQAYRLWIEAVYEEQNWDDEPSSVRLSYENFCKESDASYYCAKQLMRSSMNSLTDDDASVSVLTRDGEMSLSLVPFYINAQGEHCLLNGEPLPPQSDLTRIETINLNTVPVPHSWGKREALPEQDSDGLIWFEMQQNGAVLTMQYQQWRYQYTSTVGFQREQLQVDNELEKDA